MAIRPKHVAEQDFATFNTKIYNAVINGIHDYPRKYAEFASTHRSNTRHSLIRDHIFKRLRAELDGQHGVRINDKNGTVYFNFFGRWLVTVRMVRVLDGRHRVALNKTQLALKFQDNIDDAPSLGSMFSGVTKLYLGYVEPEGDDKPAVVVIVCPDGDRNAWHMEIELPAKAEIVPLTSKAAADDEELVRIPENRPDREANE